MQNVWATDVGKIKYLSFSISKSYGSRGVALSLRDYYKDYIEESEILPVAQRIIDSKTRSSLSPIIQHTIAVISLQNAEENTPFDSVLVKDVDEFIDKMNK